MRYVDVFEYATLTILAQGCTSFRTLQFLICRNPRRHASVPHAVSVDVFLHVKLGQGSVWILSSDSLEMRHFYRNQEFRGVSSPCLHKAISNRSGTKQGEALYDTRTITKRPPFRFLNSDRAMTLHCARCLIPVIYRSSIYMNLHMRHSARLFRNREA